MIVDGSVVSIEYTLTTDDADIRDSKVGGDPLTYEHGKHEILPALESALAGLTEGDTATLTLSPAQGYGEVDEGLFQAVPLEVIPDNARFVGAQLVAESKSGERRQVRVHEIQGEELVLDLNHPLAGRTLHFDVRVLSVA